MAVSSVLCVLAAVVATALAATNPAIFTVDGVTWDLSTLNTSVGYWYGQECTPSITYDWYLMPIWGIFQNPPGQECGDKLGHIAFQVGSDGFCWAMGTPATQLVSRTVHGRLNITYVGGDGCGSGQRVVEIRFTCSNTPMMRIRETQPMSCHYLIDWATPAGCPTNASALSWGSTMLIIILVLVVCYVGGFVAWNKFRNGMTGWELLPHVEFWKGIPSLVVDGVKFAWSPIGKLIGDGKRFTPLK